MLCKHHFSKNGQVFFHIFWVVTLIMQSRLSIRLNSQRRNQFIRPQDALIHPGEDFTRLALVRWDKQNIHLLLDFLKDHLNSNPQKFQTTTGIRRLIRIYDFIQYT
ncbi:hypothetical protein EVE90_10770 [Lacticaseibacillus paracasei]|nr:hypothetical protein EVE90_10770 [Lacticaseibacillus paracasei]